MRYAAPTSEHITMRATVVCAEALALLVDAHLAAPAPEPEPEPRESLPDDTHVGHGWVVERGDRRLYKPNGNGCFTWWLDKSGEWGGPGNWRESDLANVRPATVGDLRRVGVPITEWPDITAPEAEPVEPPNRSAVMLDGYAYQRFSNCWYVAGGDKAYTWDELCFVYEPTVIYTREEQ